MIKAVLLAVADGGEEQRPAVSLTEAIDLDHKAASRYWTFDWSRTGIRPMQVSVTEAKGQLTELVRRAEAGGEIILTRHGHGAVRLVPVKAAQDGKSRRGLLEAVRAAAFAKATAGPSAARSQDFLYGGDGLRE